jgi:hypothetical protein
MSPCARALLDLFRQIDRQLTIERGALLLSRSMMGS